jgi:hypothetical protein
VQEDLRSSTHLVPVGSTCDVDWAIRQDFAWGSNLGAVWGFAAMCHEEGWEPGSGQVDLALKSIYLYFDSPLMIVQRVGDELHATWLGAPLRAWLDFPDAQQEERDFRGDEALPAVVPDPPMPALLGRERELYEQVLADPYDRGPRDVLRDLWSERGDPRGEFCAVTSDPSLRARAADLVAAHGRSWLDGLQSVIPLSGALFGYGPFVKKAIVYAPDQAAFERVANAPAWGSIEAITFAPGSVRRVVPAMRNVRAIGPVSQNEASALRDGTWQIEDLDLEIDRQAVDEHGGVAIGRALELLQLLALPLRTLRLRPPVAIDPDWPTRLPFLERASWWQLLDRLEIWLSGTLWLNGITDRAIAELIRLFGIASVSVRCTVAIGILDGDQRTGWMLAGDRDTRRLELAHPDARFDLGTQLAAATGLPLEPELLELDDWLALGLGVPSTRRQSQ